MPNRRSGIQWVFNICLLKPRTCHHWLWGICCSIKATTPLSLHDLVSLTVHSKEEEEQRGSGDTRHGLFWARVLLGGAFSEGGTWAAGMG